MNTCPCGSGKPLATCCQPYISGLSKAPTAEALMRSRYTAYATHSTDYILKTTTDRGGKNVDPDATREWAESSEWIGLSIVKTVAGGALDTTGEVEFIARYAQDGKKEEHHEYSYFKKEKGEWRYDTGRMITDTVVRDQPKVGRNDPCPCGSGKKYKVCHGKA